MEFVLEETGALLELLKTFRKWHLDRANKIADRIQEIENGAKGIIETIPGILNGGQNGTDK